MGKLTICIGENKGADQLRSNCEADQRLCFRYSDRKKNPLLSDSKISSLLPSSVTVQAGLCWTWSDPKLLVFSHTGSYGFLHFTVLDVIRFLLGLMQLEKLNGHLHEKTTVWAFDQIRHKPAYTVTLP